MKIIPKRKLEALGQISSLEQLYGHIRPTIVMEAHIVDSGGSVGELATKFNTLLSELESAGILRSS